MMMKIFVKNEKNGEMVVKNDIDVLEVKLLQLKINKKYAML